MDDVALIGNHVCAFPFLITRTRVEHVVGAYGQNAGGQRRRYSDVISECANTQRLLHTGVEPPI